ncbi:11704_t:CDS:1, partial [Gigaspora margarita]
SIATYIDEDSTISSNLEYIEVLSQCSTGATSKIELTINETAAAFKQDLKKKRLKKKIERTLH